MLSKSVLSLLYNSFFVLDTLRMNKSAGLIFRASAIFIIISNDGFAFPDSIPPIVPVPQLQVIESCV